MEPIFTTSTDINAKPEVVWDGLVNPESTRQYMYGCNIVCDWQPGSDLNWVGAADGVTYVVGKLLKFEPYSLFEYSVFPPGASYPNVLENHLIVTLRLEPTENGTRLHVQQGDFSAVPDGENRYGDLPTGWKMILTKLKEISEG